MSSGIYASYNSFDFDYIAYKASETPVFDGESVIAYQKTFEFEAVVQYADFSAWNNGTTGLAKRLDALREPGQTLTIKDPSGNTLISFGASDCMDDGPFVDFEYENRAGYSVWFSIKVTSQIEPEGDTTTLSDTYTDTYAYNQDGRRTYTRRGTQTVSTAYADVATAMSGVEPTPPSGNWELTGKEGTLDEDGKKLEYTFTFLEVYEVLPAGFTSFSYQYDETADGRRKDITLSATGGVNIVGGSVAGMADSISKWGRGKLDKSAKIVDIHTSEDTRNGQVSLTLRAVDKVKDDVVEFSESVTTRKTQDTVVSKILGGGGGWKDLVGDPDIVVSVSGRKVGLTGYPKVDHSGDDSSFVEETPSKGPDGELLYPVSYTHEYVVVGGSSKGNGGIGGNHGGGAAGGGAGGGLGVGQPSGGLQVGDVPGFSTTGTIQRTAGGLAGERSGFSTSR